MTTDESGRFTRPASLNGRNKGEESNMVRLFFLDIDGKSRKYLRNVSILPSGRIPVSGGVYTANCLQLDLFGLSGHRHLAGSISEKSLPCKSTLMKTRGPEATGEGPSSFLSLPILYQIHVAFMPSLPSCPSCYVYSLIARSWASIDCCCLDKVS